MEYQKHLFFAGSVTSVKVGDASQNLAIYDYNKTMRTTGFKFYAQYPRGIKKTRFRLCQTAHQPDKFHCSLSPNFKILLGKILINFIVILCYFVPQSKLLQGIYLSNYNIKDLNRVEALVFDQQVQLIFFKMKFRQQNEELDIRDFNHPLRYSSAI